MNEVVRRLREPDGNVQVWVAGDLFAKDDTRALGAVGAESKGCRGRREAMVTPTVEQVMGNITPWPQIHRHLTEWIVV